MSRRIRQLPSPALVISVIALIVAVGGGSAALALSDNQQDKKITNKQISKRAPSLSVKHAKTADMASNAGQLGGIAPSGYAHSDCSSTTGQIKGFAKVDASATFSSTFTTSGVESPYNCSGGTVEAQRDDVGLYEVRFNGSPVSLATVNAFYGPPETAHAAANVSVKLLSPGIFKVGIYNSNLESFVDDPFVIVTP